MEHFLKIFGNFPNLFVEFLDEFGHLHLHTLIRILTRPGQGRQQQTQLSSPVQVKEEAGGGRHQD